jgi:hypothetical protein
VLRPGLNMEFHRATPQLLSGGLDDRFWHIAYALDINHFRIDKNVNRCNQF